MSLPDKRARLRALHHDDELLVLPNAWDAASARVLADAGFPAIATGSHAVAGSLGYDDGEAAPPGEMFAAAARITRSVDVAVSVDAESGYGLAPDELARRLREAGAAGCNIEDTLHDVRAHADGAGEAAGGSGGRPSGTPIADVETQAEFIGALRRADPELVINARVDVFDDGVLPELSDDERLEEAVTRARAYLGAGADSVFPIMVSDEALIATLVKRVPGPVNVLYRPGAPSPARLGELGVARVTFGPGLHGATLALLGRLARALRSGTEPY